MRKIIAVIEDTGERRVPLEGERWLHQHTLDGVLAGTNAGDELCAHSYQHATTGANPILVVTAIMGDVALSLKERVELTQLRAFHATVTGAAKKVGAGGSDPALMIEELERLHERLKIANDSVLDALDSLEMPDKKFDNVTDAADSAMAVKLRDIEIPGGCGAAPIPVPTPFETEEEA